MRLSPRMAVDSVKSVHLGRVFSPGQKLTVSPANAFYQNLRSVGLSANMAHDFTARLHPPKFRSGKFDTLPKNPKPLLPAVFMKKGNAIRGIPGGVKRAILTPRPLRGTPGGSKRG